MLDESMSYVFRKFEPIKRMIISRDTGLLNEYFNISKGQLIDLNYFCTIGKMDNDTPERYPVINGKTKKIVYCDASKVKSYKSGIVDIDYNGFYGDCTENKVNDSNRKKSYSLEKDVPYINNVKELEKWLSKVYIIENMLCDDVTSKKYINEFANILRACFTIRECREYKIKFKFNKNDKKTYELELRHFFVNLILWEPFVELAGLHVLTEDFIIDAYHEIPNIENYINYKTILILRDYQVKSTSINYRVADVLYNLRTISNDFSNILGLTFSIVNFMDKYENNEEIRNIMEVTFDETMQPYEIEKKVQELQDREIAIYKQDYQNPIGALLRAGTGVKAKQFSEFTIAESLKPSLTGETIPEPIENSTLIRGLDRPSYLYIDATGARKSLVMSKKVMGRAGYFGKILLLLARTLSMSTEVSDCGSTHLVEYEIKTKKHLEKLNGKYYKIDPEEMGLTPLNAKKDKDLIGKKIYVRSAVTCCLGDKVCPKCFGQTSITNLDIADGVSGYESEEISEILRRFKTLLIAGNSLEPNLPKCDNN